ncbi:MAG TPA: signal peptidase I [Nitrososphaeraceae archaeon]|nr:signal peptidase I [Nitrososphaeraceae archaeon]
MLDEKSRLPTVIKNIIVFVLGVLIIVSLYHYFETELDNPLPFFVIYSDTMTPALEINDLIIVGDGHMFNNTNVGDIIVFKKPAGEDRIIVHRITEITSENGRRVIITKGDASPVSIPGVDFPVNSHNFIGRVKFAIPEIGILFSPPLNYVLLGGIISAVVIVIFIYERKRVFRM